MGFALLQGAATASKFVTESPLMNISLSIGPIASLIAGILILLVPRLLNYIVAIYLIVMGVVGLLGMR